MILLALGANLPSPAGPPRLTLEAAVKRLRMAGVEIVSQSRWYRSRAHPPSSQPDYVNGVIAVQSRLPPRGLLDLMHKIEWDFGRRRGEANAARVIDLDLLDYDGRVADGPEAPILPHPRLHERAFVLLPLAEIAPDWLHPVSRKPLGRLIAELPRGQTAVPLKGPPPKIPGWPPPRRQNH